MKKLNLEAELAKFNFRQNIVMRWSDKDELGHVNNAFFLTYMEEYRILYLKTASNWNWDEDKLILAHIEINFRNQMAYHNLNWIYVRCSHLGNKSFTLEYLITDEHSDEKVWIADGSSILVYFDYQTNRSLKLSDSLKKKFTNFEGD